MADPSNSRAPSTRRAGWPPSKWLIFLEFGIVAAIFVADVRHLIPFSKTPFLLLLGWLSMRVRGVTWKSVGLTRNRSWRSLLAIGVAAGIALELFQLFVTQPILAKITGKQPDLSDFAALHGNIKYTLIFIALSWTLAAFGEELVWRGYLLNRVAGLGNFTRVAWTISFVLVSAAFGAAHLDQGLTGQIEEAIAGSFLAAMYLATRKNLAVPILAHGASDTLDFILIFLGKYPGM